MIPLLNLNEQPVNVTIQLLKRLNVKVTDEAIKDAILNHPDYPSILCISDTLNRFNVENAATKIDTDKLDDVSLPFIAFVETGSFVLVIEIKDNTVYYISDSSKIKSKPISQFSKDFAGIVLLAEPSEISGDKNYFERKKIEKKTQLKNYFLLALGIVAIVSSIAYSVTNNSIHFIIPFSCLLFLNFSGMIITILLLLYEADKANPSLQKICNSGKKTNCNAILNSKASKIAGISWSEVGFFYFGGSFVFLLMHPVPLIQAVSLIGFLNLIALPYTIFSVYYQWRVAKQWCTLCLTIQGILLIEFIIDIAFNILHFHILADSLTLLSLFSSFTLPILGWFIVKPLLSDKQKAKQDFRSLQRIKFNEQIFRALLERQKRVTEPPDGLGILFGNKNAENILIKVCNPYCGPCAKAHPEIEKLLEETNNLKVQIIFTATIDEKDFTALPVKHFLWIAEKNDENLTRKALDDWYLGEKKDYEAFKQKYKINGHLKNNSKLEAMSMWCKKVNIEFTPTIFFNGYQLPEAYDITDLKYFLL